MTDIFFELVSSPAPGRTDRHRLAGAVTVDSLPVRRVIMVFNRITMGMIAATVSEATTGVWELSGLAEYPVASLLIMDKGLADAGNARVFDLISQVTGV